MNYRYSPLSTTSANLHAPVRVQCACGVLFNVEPDKETYCSVRCARADAWRALSAGRSHYRLLKQLDSQENESLIPTLPPFPEELKPKPKSELLPLVNKDKALPPLPQGPDMHVVQVPSNTDLRRALPPLQIPELTLDAGTPFPTPKTLRRVSSMVVLTGNPDVRDADSPKQSYSDKHAGRPKRRREVPARLKLEVVSPSELQRSIVISGPQRPDSQDAGRELSMNFSRKFPARAAEPLADPSPMATREATHGSQCPVPPHPWSRPTHGRKRSSSFGTFDRNLRVDVPQDVKPASTTEVDENDVWATVQYLRVTTSEYIDSPSVCSVQGPTVYSQPSPVVPDLAMYPLPDAPRVPHSPVIPALNWGPNVGSKKADRLASASRWFD